MLLVTTVVALVLVEDTEGKVGFGHGEELASDDPRAHDETRVLPQIQKHSFKKAWAHRHQHHIEIRGCVTPREPSTQCPVGRQEIRIFAQDLSTVASPRRRSP